MLTIDNTPKMTPEQFVFWLRGFLEAHPEPHVAADRIAAKAKEVQTQSPTWPWTLNQPCYGGTITTTQLTGAYGLGPNETLLGQSGPRPVFLKSDGFQQHAVSNF